MKKKVLKIIGILLLACVASLTVNILVIQQIWNPPEVYMWSFIIGLLIGLPFVPWIAIVVMN